MVGRSNGFGETKRRWILTLDPQYVPEISARLYRPCKNAHYLIQKFSSLGAKEIIQKLKLYHFSACRELSLHSIIGIALPVPISPDRRDHLTHTRSSPELKFFNFFFTITSSSHWVNSCCSAIQLAICPTEVRKYWAESTLAKFISLAFLLSEGHKIQIPNYSLGWKM